MCHINDLLLNPGFSGFIGIGQLENAFTRSATKALVLGSTATMAINFIGMVAGAMNSNGSHRKPQIPVEYQKLLSIEGITKI